MRTTTLSFTLAAAVALAAVPYAAEKASAEGLSADVKKSERTYRKMPAGAGALTKNMIESCIALKTEIDNDYKEITELKEQFDALAEEVSKLGNELQANKDNVGGGSGSLVEYNKKVEFYNSRIEELKKLEQAYNTKTTPYRAKAARLKQECDGQPYYEDDYAEVVKKVGRGL
jgi:chromosome segregation ATPase